MQAKGKRGHRLLTNKHTVKLVLYDFPGESADKVVQDSRSLNTALHFYNLIYVY